MFMQAKNKTCNLNIPTQSIAKPLYNVQFWLNKWWEYIEVLLYVSITDDKSTYLYPKTVQCGSRETFYFVVQTWTKI